MYCLLSCVIFFVYIGTIRILFSIEFNYVEFMILIRVWWSILTTFTWITYWIRSIWLIRVCYLWCWSWLVICRWVCLIIPCTHTWVSRCQLECHDSITNSIIAFYHSSPKLRIHCPHFRICS